MVGTPARRLALLLGLVAFSACECVEGGDGGFTQLVPLLSPDTARVAMPGVYVGATKEATLRYHSTGTGHVAVTRVLLEDASADGFAIADAGVERLAPGETLEVRVSFTPVSEGAASVLVVVESDADNAPTRILLEANGLAPLDCGPSTTCQRRTFDPDTGACVIEDLAGTCDDGNACTEGDVCFEGECVGRAVSCPSPHECTQGLCDASEGCVLLAHDDRCEDDGNPCTAERCDLEEGCVSEVVPDGTPCGSVTMCASAALCYQGECTVFDVPDGTPCSDGDFCTVNDRCFGGECAGTRVEQPPVVAGQVRMFGTDGGRAVLLSERRVLFLDPYVEYAPLASQVGFGDPVGGYVATVVQANDDELVVLAHTEFPDQPFPLGAVEASPGVVIGFVPGGTGSTLDDSRWAPQRFEVSLDGTVTLTAVGEPSADLSPFAPAAPLPDGRLAVRGGRSRLTLLEPSDFSHTVLVDWSPGAPDEGPHIGALEAFAGGVVVTLQGGLYFVHMNGGVEPIGETFSGPGPIDSDGHVLAALRRVSNYPEPGHSVHVRLFDEDLEEIGRLPLDPDARRIALDDGRLVVGRNGPSLAYDVSNPASPTLLAQSLPWSANHVDYLVANDGVALFSANFYPTLFDTSTVLASLDDDGLRFLHHPRLGSPGALLSLGDEVLAVARTSFQRVDVGITGAPLIMEGWPLARPFELSTGRWLPLVRASSGAVVGDRRKQGIRSDAQLWVYDLSLPIVPPFPQRTVALPLYGRLASNARLIAGVEQSGPAHSQTLQLFDAFADLPPAAATYPPLSVTPLSWTLEDMGESNAPNIAMDDANRVAVVSQQTTASPWRVELALFDAAFPVAPMPRGRAVITLPDPPSLSFGRLELVVAGDAIALTHSSTRTIVVLRRLPDDSVIETMRFESDADRPIAFDGRTLVLAELGVKALSFWDVSGIAPTDLGVVELPDEPHAILSYADTLLVSGQTSFVTLDPPCPPLP